MQLSAVDIERLNSISYSSKHIRRVVAKGSPPPRIIYRDEQYFYKIWSKDYLDHRSIYWRGERRLVRNENENNREVLLGHLYGLYDETICPSFVDHIYDGATLVGYVTLPGDVSAKLSPKDPAYKAFARRLIELSLESGFIYRDFKSRNLVRLADGRLSLIDLETPPVCLNGYSVEHERRSGSLARFTFKSYRDFIDAYLDPQTTDPAICRSREQFTAGLPPRLAFDDHRSDDASKRSLPTSLYSPKLPLSFLNK